MAVQTPTNNNPEEGEVKQSYDLAYIKNLFFGILDLKKGVDKKGAIQEIKDKKSMAGANAWMLMCSIIIASIGLDRNSDAVIIGAMLISPLMSPILGIGLGIGINDKEVLKKSFIHFTAAILIAVITSTVYFLLTPFGDFTSSIESRTEPNTLDVFVAIFGGLAGIISIARKDISTTLPGVAIATALMPPLCVTGYSLANGEWNFALNSFYLFIMNTSFISISTYVIVRYLRFPYRRYLKKKERYRNRLMVLCFGLLMVIPSFFILAKSLQKTNTENTIKEFFANDFGENEIYIDSYKIYENDSTSTLAIQVYNNEITPQDEIVYEKKLNERGLENWNVIIMNSSEVNLEKINSLEKSNQKKFQEILEIAQQEKEAEDLRISMLAQQVIDSSFTAEIDKELKALFPEISSVLTGKLSERSSDKEANETYTVIVDFNKDRKISKVDRNKLMSFLKVKIKDEPYRIVIND